MTRNWMVKWEKKVNTHLAIHGLELDNDLLSLLIGSLCQETDDSLFISACIDSIHTVEATVIFEANAIVLA